MDEIYRRSHFTETNSFSDRKENKSSHIRAIFRTIVFSRILRVLQSHEMEI